MASNRTSRLTMPAYQTCGRLHRPPIRGPVQVSARQSERWVCGLSLWGDRHAVRPIWRGCGLGAARRV